MANQNALTVVESLLDNGTFLRDGNQLGYLRQGYPGTVIMLRSGPEISGLLACYGITQSSRDYHNVLELLQLRCRYESRPATIAAIGHVDADGKIYLSDGNGHFYDNPADLSSVLSNGTGDIWFARCGEQLKVDPDLTIRPVDDLLNMFNFCSNGHYNSGESKLLLKSYILSIAFFRSIMDVMPILIVSGPEQSGKTTLLGSLTTLAYGVRSQIPVLTEGAKSFESFLRYPFAAYDHVRTGISDWLPALLHAVAIGAPTEFPGRNRHNSVIFNEHLHVGIGTRSVHSKLQSVLPFALHIELDRPDTGHLRTIVNQIFVQRSAVMASLYSDAQRVMACSESLPAIPASAGYLSTFYELAVRTGVALGQRDIAESLLAKLGCAVPLTIEPNDPIYVSLKNWLSINPDAEPISSNDLISQLYAIEGNGLPNGLTGPSLSQWIKAHDELLSENLGLVKPIHVERKVKKYQFKGVVSGKGN